MLIQETKYKINNFVNFVNKRIFYIIVYHKNIIL